MENKEIIEQKTEDDNLSVPKEDTFLKPTFIKPCKIQKKVKNNDSNNCISISEKDKVTSNETTNELKKLSKGPTQRLVENSIPIPYKEPSHSSILPDKYEFEIIKNGVIVDHIKLNKPYLVVGRLSTCDIILEHPSISRFHCIVQQLLENDGREAGIYIYDLDSTHGTFLNKYKVKPKVYNRVRVGHLLKFGGSSRTFILLGPDEDQEPETLETVTELIALAKEKKEKLIKLEEGEVDEEEPTVKNSKTKEIGKETQDGINWGMADDAQEEEIEEENEDDDYENNPFESNQDLYLEDPKKTLRGWYEREGHNLPEYIVDEQKTGLFRCKLELPIPGPGGGPFICTVEHRGKKKDTVVQCALEACRILDRKCLLRQSTHESLSRKKKDWSENDYYDSDEDDYLDRTGDIEKKRKMRRRELESAKAVIETYDSAIKQYKEVTKELERLESELQKVENLKKEIKESANSRTQEEPDELDSYMNTLEAQLPDKHKRTGWKLEADRLRKEELRLRKIANATRSHGVPELPPRVSHYFNDASSTSSWKSSTNLNVNKSLPKVPVPSAMKRVHSIFMEEDEDEKPKLRKVNCNDDTDNVKPIPYATKIPSKSTKIPEFNKKIKLCGPPKADISSINVAKQNSSVSQNASSLLKKITSQPSGSQNKPEVIEDLTEKDQVSESMNLIENIPDKCDDRLQEVTTLNTTDVQSQKNLQSSSFIEPSASFVEPSPSLVVPSPSLVDPSPSLVDPSPSLVDPSPSSSVDPLPLVMKKPKESKKKKKEKNIFDYEKDYDSWVPPVGQSGDGRTSLNEKLGY